MCVCGLIIYLKKKKKEKRVCLSLNPEAPPANLKIFSCLSLPLCLFVFNKKTTFVENDGALLTGYIYKRTTPKEYRSASPLAPGELAPPTADFVCARARL